MGSRHVDRAEPRRVLLVTGLVAGGIGRHVADLAGALSDSGHHVVVACPAPVAARFRLDSGPVPVLDLPVGSLPSPQQDPVALARLRAAVRGADVVHAHGVRAGALVVLARRGLPRRARPALVLTLHNAAPAVGAGRLAHRVLHRLACRGADEVLTVSADLDTAARRAGARHVRAAVVAAPRPQPSRERASVRAELAVDAGEPLLVSVGRLAPQKGYDVLLEALSLLAAGERPTGGGEGAGRGRVSGVLAVVGEGPERPALERRLRERPPALAVQLLGHREDVADLLGAADLAVSAARWEGQPVWLQEALALGVPVLATDVGGTAEVVGEGGRLVPGADPAALARALDELLADPAGRDRLREAARRRGAELPGSAEACQAAREAYRRARARQAGVPTTAADPA